MLRRLPQAALWRSPRPAGFCDFCVRTINLTLSFVGRSSFCPRMLLQGDYHRSARKLLFLLEIVGPRLAWVGHSVLCLRARDRLSRGEIRRA